MKPVVVALGVFDGVHRGHQALLRKIVHRARELHGRSLVYTFDPHPVKILAPASCPPMIMTLKQRVASIREAGVERVVVQQFTLPFSRLGPEDFFKKILIRKLKAIEIVVGYNFTFGFHRQGTVEALRMLGKKWGLHVLIQEPFFWKETLVSSTQIRQGLSRGNLTLVSELLGHPYGVEGRVIRGRGIGRRLIGIPTANLSSENDRILPEGVYVTRTRVGQKHYRSVTNIGIRPTVGPGALSIESHLLGFHQSLMGKRIQVDFLKKIREEIKFADLADLARQIRDDIRRAREYLSRS